MIMSPKEINRSDTVVRDLFGEVPAPERMEVHEHTFISGPRGAHHSDRTIVHSHPGGNDPHQHEHTGPACYTIDKADWHRMSGGVEGGSEKIFTTAPEGEQLPIVELEDWQKSFEIHYGPMPQGFEGTGGGHLAAARMILRFKMTVSNVIPFPGPKKATG